MAISVMQGDRYSVPFILRAQDGTLITDSMVKTVVLNLGNMSRQYPGDVTYEDGKWLFPMSQKQSFTMKGSVEPQARIEFNDGTIFGGAGRKIPIVFSFNRGIIGTEETEQTRLARPVNIEIGGTKGNIGVTIGAASAGTGGGGTIEGAVRYDIAQGLTDEQQKQARDNIGAEDRAFQITCTYDSSTQKYTVDKTYAEMLSAYEAGQLLVMYYSGETFIGAQNSEFGFIFTGGGHSCGIWINDTNYIDASTLPGGSKLVVFNPDDKYNLYDGSIVVRLGRVEENFVIYYNGGFYYYYNMNSSIMRFECLRTNVTTGQMERSIMEIERNEAKGGGITVSNFEPVPAGSNSFVIKVSLPEEPDSAFTVDKTSSEIIEAFNNATQYDAIYATFYGRVFVPMDDGNDIFVCGYPSILAEPGEFGYMDSDVFVFNYKNEQPTVEFYQDQYAVLLPISSETGGVPYYDTETQQWAIKELEQDPGVFKITCTQSGNSIVADKTDAEIVAAAKAGKLPFVVFNNAYYYPENYSTTSGGDWKFRKYDDPTDVIYYFAAMYTWQHYTDNWNGRLVPSVTASDNGKFLRVVNGAWAAAEVQNANGEEF